MASRREVHATGLEADLKAWKTGFALLLAGAGLVCCALLAGWDEDGIAFAAGVPVLAGIVAAFVLLVAQRLHVGFVLRLDHEGVHSCALPTVPWAEIHGVELEAKKGENSTTYSLVLDAAPSWFARHPWAWWQSLFFWPSAKVDERAREIRLSMVFADADPHDVLAQARALARRQGRP